MHKQLIDLYQKRQSERSAKIRAFYNGGQNWLIIQRKGKGIWGECNSVKSITENNLQYLEEYLSLDWNDELPYFEPWIGTGVYAHAFGCQYVFRENTAPHVHYLYHTIDELKNAAYPDWKKSSIMQMVMESIDELKAAGNNIIPVALTDTQSPFDTATLVCDAAEVFTACYSDPEIISGFMNRITDLIIEFSSAQIERIGKNLLAAPGHIMPSLTGLPGISISDDNLAVSSPQINEQFALPCNRRIARAFGGLAVHSCGVWEHTMAKLSPSEGEIMLDCAVSRDCDPNPNDPEKIREAVKNSGLLVKIRTGSDLQKTLNILEKIFTPGIKLAVQIAFQEDKARENYLAVENKLKELYNE